MPIEILEEILEDSNIEAMCSNRQQARGLLYKKLIFLFILPLLFACNKDEQRFVPTCEDCLFDCLTPDDENIFTNDCLENWECEFNFHTDSKVDTDETEGVASGSKNVFQIIADTQGSPMIADDEFKDILVFEIDANQESFSMSTEADFKAAKTHYRVLCFCTETDFKNDIQGCIQGEKDADGNWFVQGKIEISYLWGDAEFKFDGEFE